MDRGPYTLMDASGDAHNIAQALGLARRLLNEQDENTTQDEIVAVVALAEQAALRIMSEADPAVQIAGNVVTLSNGPPQGA